MLVVSLDPEIYLKSQRTQRRMVGVLTRAISDALAGDVEVGRIAGHRLRVETSTDDAADRLSRVFGIRAVEFVARTDASDFDRLVDAIATTYADKVRGQTFAVRPNRLGKHEWSSQDLAVAAGSRLVEAGGDVDLTDPDVTVAVRIVDEVAYLTLDVTPGVGGLPAGTQGRALMMFSGGIDSPVAAYLVAHRGVVLDYLHFSLGCGAADHAAGVAHLLTDRYGAGTDPLLHVVDLEPAVLAIQRRIPARERQIALKAVMYRTAADLMRSEQGVRAVVTGESLGQVSTQTLENLAALDRLVDVPVLRPLIGFDKETITARARAIGTFDLSSRTRELCDISGGARVSVSTSAVKLAAIGESLEDLVEQAGTTIKTQRLADWVPGSG